MDVTISTPAGGIPGYPSRPGGDGLAAGVAVLHDGFGIDEAVRAQADWLAGAGYLALSVDLGFWGRPSAGLLRMSGDLRDGRPDLQPGRCGAGVAGEPARMRRAARRDRVLRHRRFRPAMAAGHGFSVSSLNYGLVRKNARTPCAGPARSWPASAGGTLLAHGSGSAGRCRRSGSITTSRCTGRRARLPAPARGEPGKVAGILARITQAGYHEPSAHVARRRIVAFFDAHLKT